MTTSSLSASARRRAAAFLAAGAALLTLQAVPARAQAISDESVARSFVQASQDQDRRTALNLLDPAVSIEFPAAARSERASGRGRAFVIGYFDGLFDGRRYELDSTAVAKTAEGGHVHFVAHEVGSHDLYGLDVDVRHQHIVKLKLDITPADSGVRTLASAEF